MNALNVVIVASAVFLAGCATKPQAIVTGAAVGAVGGAVAGGGTGAAVGAVAGGVVGAVTHSDAKAAPVSSNKVETKQVPAAAPSKIKE